MLPESVKAWICCYLLPALSGSHSPPSPSPPTPGRVGKYSKKQDPEYIKMVLSLVRLSQHSFPVLRPSNHWGTHSFQIPKASSEGITFFLSPQACLCLPYDALPRSRNLPVRSEYAPQYGATKPSVPCRGRLCISSKTHRGRHKFTKPKELLPLPVCPNLCANTSGFCWETVSCGAHSRNFLLELWNVSWCLNQQSPQ